ncbi:DUF177 domain-containing protein [Sphingomonas sp.]|jgi:uncharacterized metal-binding protein YceD (DUF177 family)|uniref:YceD family protein n=1 Tax=Sphingomonas sp. TaxID=28214 RepID=UPI002E30AF50|nr:DUF177 domain-containing protein [Sphingomonas sp.]HEX4695777.1 DUF177 domain-containing protein [Sphingomonas sp.]
MSDVEFARPQRLDTIGGEVRAVAVEAGEAERAALAKRFDLIAIDRLAGDFTIRREAAGILVEGRVTAGLTQACSVTGEPLTATIDEPVSLRFVAAGTESQEEVELGDEDIDVIPYDGGAIDLGEVAAETVALAIDPFVRGPGAEAMLRAAGVLSEEEAGPFGALAGLRDKLGGT